MEAVAISEAFWRDRRVLITGVTGFKGGWLALWLRELGATVLGYSLPPPSKPSLFDEGGVCRAATWIEGDIRDRAALQRAIRQASPEIVFHLAAQPIVRTSYDLPVETFETNVLGTVNLLEALRECESTSAVVVVTTDKCYENREWCWPYRETDALGGYDPYSSSKACAEIATAAYYRSFYQARGVGVATARAGNVVGGGDWARDRLIPDCVACLERGETIVVRNPGSVRPWQHVLEPLHGYLALAERLATDGSLFAGAWNFGPEAAAIRPVSEVVETFCSLWEGGNGWRSAEGPAPHEASVLALDSSKARTRLGWRPALTLPEALQWTVAWQQARRTGRDMHDYSLGQIRKYRELSS